MVIFICAFFSVLLGVLLGLFVGFFLFGLFGFQRKSRVKNDIPSPKREIIEPQESQESIKTIQLKDKLHSSSLSLDEFNCLADGVDYNEYLSKAKKNENNAYRCLKQEK